jgi:hypothetical protein
VLPWLVLLLVAGAGYGIYRWLHPSDTVVIRQLLEKVATTASFAAEDSSIRRFASVGALADCFHADVQIMLENLPAGGRSVQGRDELRQIAAATRTQLPFLEVSFKNAVVEVDAEGRTAAANVIAAGRAGRAEDTYYQELRFTLVKEEGRWWILRVEPVAALRP